MAKRICFAWREYWYDFDTEEEAQKFIKDNSRKGWFFPKDKPYKGYGEEVNIWCVQVRKPVKGYNPGW